MFELLQNWALELEDVFVVNREGEDERFEPFKKISNRMLLWHGAYNLLIHGMPLPSGNCVHTWKCDSRNMLSAGSRTTNFVGILSQGLRIAPPEAPASGYMVSGCLLLLLVPCNHASDKQIHDKCCLLCSLGKEYILRT